MRPKPKLPKRKRSIAARKLSSSEIHEKVMRFVLVCHRMVETAEQMLLANHILMDKARDQQQMINETRADKWIWMTNPMRTSAEIVLAKHPGAYVTVRGNFFHVVRPREETDRRAGSPVVRMSCLHQNADSAWAEAAKRIVSSGPE